MKDREDAAIAARKLTKRAFDNMNTKLKNKYTEQWDLKKSDESEQAMKDLQNRVYKSESNRNRRA
jgi:hypothetical protein